MLVFIFGEKLRGIHGRFKSFVGKAQKPNANPNENGQGSH